MKIKYLFVIFVAIVSVSCSTEVRDRILLRNIDNLFHEGKLDEAKLTIDSFISHRADNEMAWLLKGDIEENLNNDSLAQGAYEKVLEMNPNSEQAITGMGILHRKRGNFEEASGYYHKAIQINPNYAQAYSSLVMIELKRRNFEEAVILGEKAFELENNDPTIAANLSIAYHYKGDSTSRDRFYSVAKSLNYKNLKILRMIYNGKATILD